MVRLTELRCKVAIGNGRWVDWAFISKGKMRGSTGKESARQEDSARPPNRKRSTAVTWLHVMNTSVYLQSLVFLSLRKCKTLLNMSGSSLIQGSLSSIKRWPWNLKNLKQWASSFEDFSPSNRKQLRLPSRISKSTAKPWPVNITHVSRSSSTLLRNFMKDSTKSVADACAPMCHCSTHRNCSEFSAIQWLKHADEWQEERDSCFFLTS